VAVVLAEEQAAGQVAVQVEPEAAAGQLGVAVVLAAEQVEPGLAAVMGLEPALGRLQGQASARVLLLRSALVQMLPSALALAHQLVRVRPAVPGWVPVPVRPSDPARAGLSVKEPATDPVTGPGTRVSGLKTGPVLERLRSARKEQIKEQSGISSETLCSLI
jgi:hypothetical protein